MADSWALVTPAGNYQLNPTFSAAQYEPGSVAPPGALRRDERTSYQRSGDGNRTPGPFVLQGIVWSDAQDIPAMVSERNAIQAAVNSATAVIRTNQAGTYTYSDLAGGPTIEVVPDGLGGWSIRIELWPGRAEPTFAPSGGGGDVDVLAASIIRLDWPWNGAPLPIPDAPHPPGSLLVIALNAFWYSDGLDDANGLTNVNNLNNLDALVDEAGMNPVRVWAFRRVLDGNETTAAITPSDNLSGYAQLIVLAPGNNTADVHMVTINTGQPAITGTATSTGRQLFMGALEEYGVG